MKHFGDVIASAGQQTVDANLEKASKIGNIFHSSTDSIWMMYDKFRDTYEQVKNGANVKDLLMQVIVTPDAAGVARLFKIDDYNLTGYITNYLKELKGQYYTQNGIYIRKIVAQKKLPHFAHQLQQTQITRIHGLVGYTSAIIRKVQLHRFQLLPRLSIIS